ncbi:MAG: PAC2 family protein [Candidatus Bathyarchaeia archaeon]
MVCAVRLLEEPDLLNPILIEGLPGIGFVASIVTLHLIRELNARLFAEIKSSAFQDFSTSTEDGNVLTPKNQLYYKKRGGGREDLVFLYGNTQALTSTGQYELCGYILDLFQRFRGKTVVTLGGIHTPEVSMPPKVYCAATDKETLEKAAAKGAFIIKGGQIFGVAGLLIGLSKMRGIHGLCLLGETVGDSPDPEAALAVMKVLQDVVGLDAGLSGLDLRAKETSFLHEFISKPYHTKGEKDYFLF